MNPMAIWAKFKTVVLFCIAGVVFLFATNPSFALGEPSECKVIVKKVLLKNISNDWVPVALPEHEADLLSEDSIVSFVNFDKIKPGKYVNIKVVLSETFKISGRIGNNFTRAGGEITVGGTAVRSSDLPGDITSIRIVSPTWDKQKEGEVIEHLNLDYEDTNDTMEIYPKRNFQKPFLVKKGTAIHIWVTVNLSHTLYFAFPNSIRKGLPAENVMYFIPPTLIDEVGIAAGPVSNYASGDEVAFDF